MADNNPIKYSDLFIDDGAIEKLIEKLNQVEKSYKDLSKSINKEAQKIKSETKNVNLTDDDAIKRITELEQKIESLQKKRKKEKETLTEVEKLKRKLIRLDTEQAKKEQEYIDSGTQASVKALQKEIDSGKYSGGSDFAKSNQAAVGGGSTAKNKQGQTAAQATKAGTGTSQGYSQHYARGGLATMFTRRR